jgi:redox-sensing transcriptional repressor
VTSVRPTGRRGSSGTLRGVPLPDATIARLPLYLRALASLADGGARTVSSDALAAASGVTSAKVRKDLSQLGSYGTRGVGYDTDQLIDEISRVLGLGDHRCVVLVGVGNLGRALAGYAGFATKGFRIVALVDAAPSCIGQQVGGLVVQPLSALEHLITSGGISIGVIATPAPKAQEVCDRMVAAGVTGILNFAPVVLTVPEGVDVRKVDLSIELQILSFHEQRKARDLAGRRAAAADLLPELLVHADEPADDARLTAVGR